MGPKRIVGPGPKEDLWKLLWARMIVGLNETVVGLYVVLIVLYGLIVYYILPLQFAYNHG